MCRDGEKKKFKNHCSRENLMVVSNGSPRRMFSRRKIQKFKSLETVYVGTHTITHVCILYYTR